MNRLNYFIIFFVSLFCLALELFLTRILNLKTWNHLVYIIIPLAMLGYGIGANVYLIFKEKLDRYPSFRLIAAVLLSLSVLTMLSVLAIIYLPIRLDDIEHLLSNPQAILRLVEAYTIVLVPFSFIGFLTVYFFSVFPATGAAVAARATASSIFRILTLNVKALPARG